LVNNYSHFKEEGYLHFQGQRNDPEDGSSMLKLPCNTDNYVLPKTSVFKNTAARNSNLKNLLPSYILISLKQICSFGELA